MSPLAQSLGYCPRALSATHSNEREAWPRSARDAVRASESVRLVAGVPLNRKSDFLLSTLTNLVKEIWSAAIISACCRPELRNRLRVVEG